MLGHKIVGSGPEHVLVMHDWFSDCSSYDAMLPFLDTKAFTYAFVDLRGYGKSKEITGRYDVSEASEDVRALVNALKWDRYHVVGHSMSGMIAQRIAIDAPTHVKSVVAITPVPACGSQAPTEAMAFMEDAARQNDQGGAQCIAFMTGNRYTPAFADFKVKTWRKCALPEARVGYMRMFCATDFASEAKGLVTRMLVICTEFDAEAHQEGRAKETFLQWYPNAQVVTLANAGHYPMQEIPLNLIATMEKFLLA